MVLFTGDHGDNGQGRDDFAERARGFWGPTLPRIQSLPMVLTLGNADFRQNYQTDPANLAETETLYRALFGPQYYLDALGNGVRSLLGQRWVSLNTQIFSPKNRFEGASLQEGQALDWLGGQLVGSGPVVLLLHIPPTVDLFTGKPAWGASALKRFWSLVEVYAGPVTILGGHFHRNEVHVFRRSQGDVTTLVTGSLSRKYGYTPNWRSQRWTLAGDGRLQQVDYQLCYPGHAEYSQKYRVSSGDFLAQVDRQAYLNDVFAHHPEIKDRWKELTDQFWISP
jgi:hypothetical protein